MAPGWTGDDVVTSKRKTFDGSRDVDRPCIGRPVGRLSNWARGLGAVVAVGIFAMSVSSAAKSGDVYTIARYPVQAVASDAVAAKNQAMAEGQQRAFRSLMKRIVPVTSYKQLPRLKLGRIVDLMDGFAVRSEQNSSTEYIASLDFRFKRKAVRQLLMSYGIATVDQQASPVTLVPVFSAGPSDDGGLGASRGPYRLDQGSRDWLAAWRGLDLRNSVSPLKVLPLKNVVRGQAVRGLVEGDNSKMTILQEEYGTRSIVLAFAEPRSDGRKLTISLIGIDAVGPLRLRRNLPIDQGDLGFTTELAAVIGLGILEGRWKAVNAGASGSAQSAAGGGEMVKFTVAYNGIGDWQRIRQQLTQIPGVSGLGTNAVSARGAEVTLLYPGGVAAFQGRLPERGFQLNNFGGVWVLERL